MTGYDCAKIPSPSKAADSAELVNVVNGFCGGDLGTAGTAVEATVCCEHICFLICLDPTSFYFHFSQIYTLPRSIFE